MVNGFGQALSGLGALARQSGGLQQGESGVSALLRGAQQQQLQQQKLQQQEALANLLEIQGLPDRAAAIRGGVGIEGLKALGDVQQEARLGKTQDLLGGLISQPTTIAQPATGAEVSPIDQQIQDLRQQETQAAAIATIDPRAKAQLDLVQRRLGVLNEQKRFEREQEAKVAQEQRQPKVEARKLTARKRAEKELLKPKAESALVEAEERNSRLIDEIDDMLEEDGGIGFFTTGLTGSSLAGIAGTDAFDFAKRLDTLKANIGFGELDRMRQSSPTGGALGQVSEREINFLQSVLGSLDQGQSEEQFRKNFQKLRNSLSKQGVRLRKAFEKDFSGIKTKEQVDPARARLEELRAKAAGQ